MPKRLISKNLFDDDKVQTAISDINFATGNETLLLCVLCVRLLERNLGIQEEGRNCRLVEKIIIIS